jgi:LysM repeat protein
MSVATDVAPVVFVPERARRGRTGTGGTATVLPFRPAVLARPAPPSESPPEVSLREAADAVPRWYPVLPAPSSVGRPEVTTHALPVRLTRRGYAVLGVLAVGLVTGLLWFAHVSAADTPAMTTRPPAVVTVHEGDTLWSIASQIAPQRDPRTVVAQLERVNHLSDPILQPGQRLRTQ